MSIPKTDPTDNTKKDPDEWSRAKWCTGLVFENPVRAGRDVRAIR